MKRRHPRRRALIAMLLLLFLAGAALLALYSTAPGLLVERLDATATLTESASEAEGQAGAFPEARAPIPSAPPPEARFAVIALRPLFAPDRRPPEKPNAPLATPGSAEAPNVLVTGIVSAGADSVAILEPVQPAPDEEDAPRVARVGDEIAGWKVESIEASGVVLVRDGERVELPLIDEDDPRRSGMRRRMPMPGQQRTAPQTQQQAPQAPAPPATFRQPPQPPANAGRPAQQPQRQ